MRSLFLIPLVLVGCSTIKSSSPQEKPIEITSYKNLFLDKDFSLGSCPYVTGQPSDMPGAKYVVEANTWIDWSEDFYNWHYHGRDRSATSEEIELYELNAKIMKESTPQSECDALRVKYMQMYSRYAVILELLRKDDEERYNKRIQELIYK